MRNYEEETRKRVAFIRRVVTQAGAKGIVYGNSGGKDSALAGILCKMACDNTTGLIMPCGAARNYGADRSDALKIAAQYGIATRLVDLTETKDSFVSALCSTCVLTDAAHINIAPRLRMAVLYAVAASEGRLVAGTGNRSEGYMGYFTKWGDAACDFNPIADLTVTEIYAFLRHLGAPAFLFEKTPSAGLFDGQTDESEMGIAYQSIDGFLLTGQASEAEREIIAQLHSASAHKRRGAVTYPTQCTAEKT